MHWCPAKQGDVWWPWGEFTCRYCHHTWDTAPALPYPEPE